MTSAPSRSIRPISGMILLAALGFEPTGWFSPVGPAVCHAQYESVGEGFDFSVQDPDEAMTYEDPAGSSRRTRSRSARKGGRRSASRTVRKGDPKGKADLNASEPKFSRDVAPILVGNCVECHTGDGAGLRKGKLDLSSFEKLMAGTPAHKAVVPGKPLESHLYLRVHGDETPRMPQGNDLGLSEAAIARIERWIKAGAGLDPGLDAKAAFQSYAATPEELRKLEFASLSVQERDRKVEDAGKSRFAQANPKLKPEITRGDHFLLFGNLPKDRSAQAVRVLESQYRNLEKILGPEATDWPEKVGVYVFNDPKDLIEFIRTVESREVEPEVQATARLSVAEPYVAVLDPARGGREVSTSSHSGSRRRSSRSKKHDEASSALGAERTLAGLMTETLATGALNAAGKPPVWLSAGIGAYLAARLEPRGAHTRKLQSTVADVCRTGWNPKLELALADSMEMRSDEMQAIGYALVDWLVSPELGRAFPAFVAGMLKGPTNLPEVLRTVYDSNREQFMANSGLWVVERFGELQ